MSNIGRPVINRYKVPAKQWTSMPNSRKSQYNKIMHAMRPSQRHKFNAGRVWWMRAKDWNEFRNMLATHLSDALI